MNPSKPNIMERGIVAQRKNWRKCPKERLQGKSYIYMWYV